MYIQIFIGRIQEFTHMFLILASGFSEIFNKAYITHQFLLKLFVCVDMYLWSSIAYKCWGKIYCIKMHLETFNL